MDRHPITPEQVFRLGQEAERFNNLTDVLKAKIYAWSDGDGAVARTFFGNISELQQTSYRSVLHATFGEISYERASREIAEDISRLDDMIHKVDVLMYGPTGRPRRSGRRLKEKIQAEMKEVRDSVSESKKVVKRFLHAVRRKLRKDHKTRAQCEAPQEEVCPEEAPMEEVCPWKAPQEELCPQKAPVEEVCPWKAPMEEVCPWEAPQEEVYPEEAPMEEVCLRKAPQEELCPQKAPVEEVCPWEAPQEEVCPEEAPMEEVCPRKASQEKFCPQKAPAEEVYPQKAPMEEVCPWEAPMEEVCPWKAPQEEACPQKAPQAEVYPWKARMDDKPQRVGWSQFVLTRVAEDSVSKRRVRSRPRNQRVRRSP